MPKDISAFYLLVKKRLKEKRLLLTYLQIFILAVLIPICIIAIWFFSDVYEIMQRNADYINRQSVESSGTQMNNIIEDIEKLAFKMENTAFFYPAPFARDTLLSVDTFKMYHNVNRYLNSIAILYKTTDKVLTTTGTTEQSLFFLGIPEREALIEDILKCSSPRFFSSVAYGEPCSSSRVIYVYPLPRQSNNPNHVAVFQIASRTIEQVLSAPQSLGTGEKQVLLNTDGQLLWSNLPFSSADIANPAWLVENFSSGQPDFQIEQPLSYGLTLLYSIESNINLAILKKTLHYFVLCCVFILSAGIVITLTGVYLTYRPIGRMVKSIRDQSEDTSESDSEIETINRALTAASRMGDSLKNHLNVNLSDLRSMFVINAIRGRFSDKESLNNVCANLHLDLSSRYYFCCCILLDAVSDTEGRISGIDGQLMADTLKRIDSSVHGYFYQCFGFAMTVGIVCCDSDDIAERMKIMMRIQQEFEKNDSATATLSFGGAYQDLLIIGRSYIEAKSALDYRFIKGSGRIISSEEINTSSDNGAISHTQLTDTFAQDIRSLDFERITDTLEHIMGSIRGGNYSLYQTKCICFDLISTFLHEVNLINSRMSVNLYRIFNVFSIAEFESLDELVESLKLLSGNISKFLLETNNTDSQRAVNEYVDYLRQNISNNQFLIDTMAAHFDISVQQLRQSFKEHMGISVIEFFNNIKMERAKELLRETDEDIASIVQKIGYTDASSFIRKFRTEVGMTPGKYRNSYNKKDVLS